MVRLREREAARDVTEVYYMKKRESARIVLSLEAQKMLAVDVCQRQHVEACGVLFGSTDEQGNWHVERIHPLRNIYDSPVYFEFAPEELLMIELNYPGQMIGVYHSHPTGFAQASSIDRKNMRRVNQDEQIPWVWLIISGPFDEQFLRQANGLVPKAAMIAYHHYPHMGLQQISLETRGPREDIP